MSVTPPKRVPVPMLTLFVLAAVVSGAQAEQLDPAEIIAQIQASEADLEAAVRVTGHRLTAGLATVHLIDGVLVPATPVGGRSMEFVFVGSGRIRLDPPDTVEADQLELFTGSASLDEAFERAAFVIARDEAEEALLALPAVTDDLRLGVASTVLREWQSSPERRLLDVEARLLVDAVQNPLGGNYFTGYFESVGLGKFLYVVDPLADEQVSLGQFVAPELSRREQREARRFLEREQREGKLIGVELGDLGIWDTWISTSLPGPGGEPTRGSSGIEPTHYALDLTLRGRQLELEATARIDLEILVDGVNTLTLQMGPDLLPVEVRDADGATLPYLRTLKELTVVLPRPRDAGSDYSVELRYTGKPIERVALDTYVQRRPLGWYPRAGSIDRATYEVSIRWPKYFELFGSGRVVDEGRDDEGYRWQRRRLDVRALGFSFELGNYQVVSGMSGHVAVTVAIDSLGQKISHQLAGEVLESVQSSLAYFEELFGPYPIDELVVVSAPRGHSQGLLGFVTLSTAALRDRDAWGWILGLEDRRTLIAHEVAHQWWGNLVGWRDYRDQWISEAMASYSALLYARNRLDAESIEIVRVGPTKGWRSALLATTAGGRTMESLGPVVLGTRLRSSLSGSAYHSIVYKKGAVVLDMLARYFSEDFFIRILREVVRVASDRLVSTEGFLEMVSRLGGTDLEWFGSQYVYGTGLPEVEYEYRVSGSNQTGWVIEGVTHQRSPHRFRHRVVQREGGGYDVRRQAVELLNADASVLTVPIRIGLTGSDPDSPVAAIAGPRRVMGGSLTLQGGSSQFRYQLDERPEILWLDPDGEVFGLFFSTVNRPKRSAYQRGLGLVASGDSAGAERTLREALGATPVDYPPAWQHLAGDSAYEDRLLDSGIRLALARLYLDSDRDAAAAVELEEARDVIPGGYRRRFVNDLVALDARLKLRAGNSKAAFKQLRRAVLRDDEVDSAEAYALLAIAARSMGEDEISDSACRTAARRGVDVSVLECF
jgi:hypothetical protein